MEPTPDRERDIRAVATLADPVRRAIYEHVAAQDGELSRDQVAAATGVTRSLAVFHLDRLVREGLLDTSYRRLGDRTGPGAGRPSKLYRRAAAEFGVTLPQRQYEMAARLLLQATVGGPAGGAVATLNRAASELGETLGRDERRTAALGDEAAPVEQLLDVLRRHGFEPFVDPDGVVRLRNCPFHALAQSEPETVCGMNLSLVGGIVDGLGDLDATPELEFRPDLCCVAIRPHHRRLGRRSARGRSGPAAGPAAPS